MPYTTNYSLNPNQDICNYIEDVNYGMSKPQTNHLNNLIHGLITVHGNKSIASISRAVLTAKDNSCIYRFLGTSSWNDNLLNRNRIGYLNHFLEQCVEPQPVGFLIIDDTVNPKPKAKKIEGLDYHFSHIENKSMWSHCVVTSNFTLGDISIPIDYHPYYRKEKCENIDRPFKSKMQIAEELINNFKAPSGCEKIYVLTDSWYSNKDVIYTSIKQGYHFIGTVKSNRLISPMGIKLQLSEFVKYIDPNVLDVVTVKGKKYRVYIYEGPIAKIENALVVISYEVNKDGFKKPVFLISTDVELDAKTIIEYYLNRWTVETNYKYLKTNLGFDKYRVRSLLSIERYFLIVFLAINFLEIFKVNHEELMIKSLGKSIECQRNISIREFVPYIYHKTKNNVSM
ncbi:MAG TPA: IS701 family transposase [Tissierellales bacterium]|nr:IS701 family transposase [Tissierellales bacterium]